MSDIDTDIEMQAAEWAVKAMGGEIGEADIIALSDWMAVSPRHVEAYRHAMTLWAGLDPVVPDAFVTDTSTDVAAIVTPQIMSRPAARPHARKPHLAWLGGGATVMAAAIAAIFVFGQAPAVTYATAKGERREVVLSDGTHLMLNTDSRVVARLGRTRTLTLEKGEIALDVVHDAAHPFVVNSGDARLTDIGTQFNVARLDGVTRVTVREGEVELAARGESRNLKAGDMGTHDEASGRNSFAKADPQEAFAWQSAHAIYRNQPLSAVVRDLNRYYDRPMIVDAGAGQLRLNVILTLDSQTAVAGRLGEFLPLEVRVTDEAIYLSRRGDTGSASGDGSRGG